MDNKSHDRPQISPEEALGVAADGFSIPVSQVEEIPSELGRNFLLREESSGREYSLEVAHSDVDPQVLDFQNRILEHLARSGFSLAKVLFARSGMEWVEVPGHGGQVFLTRLLTRPPGRVLAHVNPQTPDLFRSMGSFLGGMDRVLGDFSHPAQDRELKLDLKGAGRVVRSHLEFVADGEWRELLEEMSQRFLEQLGPLVPELRMSVIHGAVSNHSILVGAPGEGVTPNSRRVTGIIDFGEAVRSFTAGEIAIGAASAMLGKSDPLTVASQIIGGYHNSFSLKEEEIAALYPLVGLRLCTNVAISAHQKTMEPENESLAEDEAPAWNLLEMLEKESQAFPHYLFRQACGLEAVPTSGAVVGWLKDHGAEASSVVGMAPPTSPPDPLPDDASPEAPVPLDLQDTPLHVLDFSIGSGEFGITPEPQDVVEWTKLVFRKMKAVGAEVGVGRYDEARRWYTSDIFQAPTDGAPEWRTVHMGVDLFMDAGSPVFAPFDATIHSVGHNEGDLDYGPTVILEHQPQDSPTFWTLYGHLGDEVLTSLDQGQGVAKGEAFATIGNFPGNGNWAPHLHFQLITDTLEMHGNFPGVARPSQRELWKALSPDPNLILGMPDPGEGSAIGGRDLMNPERPGPAEAGKPSGVPLGTDVGHTKEQNLQLRGEYLGPNLSVAYQRPLKIVRGAGQYLYDDEGQAFLDCVNNVPNVGHNHPRVVEAGRRQMAILNTNTRYLHDLLVEYAEDLVALLPGGLSKVYFVNSGSEAGELALRMARAHTGQKDIVVVDGAYHGNTSTLVDVSPYQFDRVGGEGIRSWVHKVPIPDAYRGIIRSLSGEEFVEGQESAASPGSADEGKGGETEQATYLPADEVGPAYAEQVRQVLNLMRAGGRHPAAFICESMLGCGGQIVLPDGYMAGAFQHVRDAGGVCIADEIQVGFGRAGTHFWAFESQGVAPDIVTLGKPMGNGHPLGAVITTPEIAESFNTGLEYFNTYGGNPVSCAIGLAVLDVIREEGLQENARVVGEHLLAGLKELQTKYPLIGDIRGLGLFIGAEIVEDPETREPDAVRAGRIEERLRDHHLLLSTDGPQDIVLMIKPPLVFTTENADRLISTLDKILQEEEFQG
jgi:4-aminobutyrate aminotransferase-like enzyme/Ser/Thr protein kinase RdoA (MazF antagonist)